jgi:hypothetical protein
MDIVFSSLNSPSIQIHPAITINDDYSFYQITTEKCPVSHIVTLKSTTFLALNHDGRIYIFNLKNNGFFPKDFQNYYIEGIRDKLTAYFTYEPFTYEPRDTSKDKQKAIIDDTTNTYRFVPIRAIRSQDCRQTEALDLSNAKKKIEELNVILTQTCPDFYLRINYIASFPPNSNIHLFSTIFPHDLNSFYTFPNIVLCLFTGNDCVSSITMHFIHDDGVLGKISELSIDSKTSLRFEGRKFNKLLRAVAIIISKEIDPTVDTLTSLASNPVSALIMINSFNAYTLDIDRKKFIGKPAPVDLRLLKTYVELNDDNIENAKSVFMDIIQTKNKDKRIKCDKQKDETAADRIRSRYYGRLGINFGRGGKQTKKRRGHKQKGRKQSGGRKRTTYKLK